MYYAIMMETIGTPELTCNDDKGNPTLFRSKQGAEKEIEFPEDETVVCVEIQGAGTLIVCITDPDCDVHSIIGGDSSVLTIED